MNYPGIENHILFFIIFNVVEDPGCVKPVEVVGEPFPDMEELHLADGELVEGDLLVNQPQLHYQGDDDGAVDRICCLGAGGKVGSMVVQSTISNPAWA